MNLTPQDYKAIVTVCAVITLCALVWALAPLLGIPS